ncbi:MAG: DoxX family protein [Flavobacteriaceae bacterium]|nr:DoxX family protein [Bacteroidia bacterium]NNK81746.1 DoxX family protein [Flavobacteriaceae bacterium]
MQKKLFLILRIIVAVILIQTLRFKFTAHEDSVYIFQTLGLEPYGRIGIGIIELIAGLLILIPRTIWIGAGLTLSVISGALFFHLTRLGIEVKDDGGILFITALVTFLLALIILVYYKKQMPFLKWKN